jgi:hypothetical protein
MGGSEAAILTLTMLLGLCCPLSIVFGVVGLMVAAPFLYAKKIAAWTADATPPEAYQRLAQGATTGGFQVRPCSYMREGQASSAHPPEVVIEHLATTIFSGGWGRQLLYRDASGVVGEMRYIKWLATDMGWVAAVVVEPSPEGGSVVHYRFRTTQMIPVITFFLAMRLNMHVVPHLAP